MTVELGKIKKIKIDNYYRFHYSIIIDNKIHREFTSGIIDPSYHYKDEEKMVLEYFKRFIGQEIAKNYIE